jgi:hypothetical protein
MRAKAEQKVNGAQTPMSMPINVPASAPAMSDEELIKIFSTGEKVDKTPRGAKPPPNKKKKGKK